MIVAEFGMELYTINQPHPVTHHLYARFVLRQFLELIRDTIYGKLMPVVDNDLSRKALKDFIIPKRCNGYISPLMKAHFNYFRTESPAKKLKSSAYSEHRYPGMP